MMMIRDFDWAGRHRRQILFWLWPAREATILAAAHMMPQLPLRF